MEQAPGSAERVAPIDLDTYLTSLPTLYEVDGEIMENTDTHGHLFYHWLCKEYPQFRDIDGVSLEALYLKNVVEGDMTLADFCGYCESSGNQFPVPVPTMREENGYYLYNFQKYLDEQSVANDTAYEIWAYERGIDTKPGAVMIFIDSEGVRNRVHTDTKNRGQLIID